jgi:hypothetical protein
MQTRRDFLAVTSAAMATAFLPESLLAQSRLPEVFSNANLGAYGQGLLTQATFERLIGSTFTVFVGTDLYAFLTLRSVTNLVPAASTAAPRTSTPRPSPASSPSSKAPIPITSFYVDFSIEGPVFPQDTYTLDHGILGRFAAFLVPGQSTGSEPRCGATFTYLSAKA